MQCVVCGPSFCLICMNNTQCHILCSVQYMYSNRIAYLHIIMHCNNFYCMLECLHDSAKGQLECVSSRVLPSALCGTSRVV